VNPIESLDEHWIRDNIERKLKLFDQPSEPEPAKIPIKELKKKKRAPRTPRNAGGR
jgi:hypothetical protein